MNFKKRVNGSWHDIPYYLHNTSTDTITTLPADIYANAATATVGLKGQTVQSGTPTPDSPITPQGTGERTGNIVAAEADRTSPMPGLSVVWKKGGSEMIIDGKATGGDSARFATFELDAGTYTLSITGLDETGWNKTGFYLSGVDTARVQDVRTYTITEPTIAKLQFVVNVSDISYENRKVTIMFTKTSTALPYEPYGNKIPISSANTTTNVYLGEVQTTRKIKKLVLTGQESGWTKNDAIAQSNTYYRSISGYYRYNGLCSHYATVNNVRAETGVYFGENINFLTLLSDEIDTVDKWKTYLQQQYANGTPVTVWHVLKTETTGIVNEPLMRIGDYADEISNISIPVTAGGDTISVGTIVQPSEVTVNYKGWHPVADVHVYPDSSWMPTSWEEFRKAVRSGKAQSLYPVGTKLYENWGDDTSNAWIVVDYPTDSRYIDADLAQQGYTNRVMLMEEKLNYLRVFDAKEAWLYVETAIPAGTYRFTIPNYDTSYGGNKTYIFTSTTNVPVGGQLTLTWAYNTNPTKVQGYSSSTSTTALFDVNIAEWDGTTACTDLGAIKLAMSDADSTYGKLNHIHRARYGSNNYYQSGLRQWLNADATANNWWTPSNIFDRPYDNRNTAGRLNALNSNMKAVLATPTVNCITNNLFEYPSLDGTTFSLQTAYTVKDKLFPVTHTETNLSSTPNVDSVLAYYTNAQNTDRIKYRKDNGNAYYWWLRTPYPTGANSVRYVYTSGALSYCDATSTSGSAAACIIQ